MGINKNLLIHKIKNFILKQENNEYKFPNNIVKLIWRYGKQVPTTLNRLLVKKNVLYIDVSDKFEKNSVEKFSDFDTDEILMVYDYLNNKFGGNCYDE